MIIPPPSLSSQTNQPTETVVVFGGFVGLFGFFGCFFFKQLKVMGLLVLVPPWRQIETPFISMWKRRVLSESEAWSLNGNV